MAEFQIKTDTDSLAEIRAARKQRKFTQMVIIGTIVACTALVLFAIFVTVRGRQQAEQNFAERPEIPPKVPQAKPPAGEEPVPSVVDPAADEKPAPPAAEPVNLIDDDGQTMWMSPTSGNAVALAYLPPGCQMIVLLRPADLIASGQSDMVLAALGPRGQQATEWIERTTGRRLDGIEQLVVGLRPGQNFVPEVTLVVTPTSGSPPSGSVGGMQVLVPDNSKNIYVVGSPVAVGEVRDQGDSPAIIRREIELVASMTDTTRHVTVIAAPSFLFNEGRRMWSGPFAELRDTVFDLLPDQTRAAALSLHWGNDFFAELRLAATLELRPDELAESLERKINTWPTAAEQALVGLSAEPYGRAIVARLPAMLRVMSRYLRTARDDKTALVRCYLPLPAGHNLLMAGELMVAELASGPASASPRATPSKADMTLAERLQQPTSLSFTRDTLEMALKMLADDAGIEIELAGSDLQLDGITKNQSFGLDLKDKPAGEILIAILRQANPDKTATGPADPKQKLVYVVVTDPQDKQQRIKVTTRAQAEKRGETLPRAFAE